MGIKDKHKDGHEKIPKTAGVITDKGTSTDTGKSTTTEADNKKTKSWTDRLKTVWKSLDCFSNEYGLWWM